MRRIAACLFSLLFLTTFCLAQSPEAPTTEDVKRFMEVLRVRKQAETMLDIMVKSAKQGARQGFLSKVPDATPQQAKDVESLMDVVFGQLNVDDVLADAVPVYQKHISKADLNAVTEFYSSPAGQRFLDKQPEMMREMGELSSKRMQTKLSDLIEQLDLKMNALAEKWKKDAGQKSPTNTTIKN